ncbi:valyl-tRNA synthetase mitochondrial precursor [Penicillium canescens]|nr:valyl-tRNA synthetase mitochondrial precursor [Penicillium canescens]
MAHNTASAQLSAIKSLIFPVSADPNIHLDVKDRIKDAQKETEKAKAKLNQARKDQGDIDPLEAELGKVQDKDVTEAMRSAKSRKLDIRARLRALEETITMFEKIMF